MSRKTLLVLLALTPLLAACGDEGKGARETQLTVSAAASLQPVAAELRRAFEAAHPEIGVTLNLAASGTLQRQIERGAPVDVFLSAGDPPMDALEEAGRIEPASRRVFASNELVLIVPAKGGAGVREFRDLRSPAVGRVAIGAPESVPAGAYALESFRSLGMDSVVLRKTVRAQHVRQVLTYVERGEVDAGLVYRTDAAGARGVRVVAPAPTGSHSPIRYPLAVVSATRNAAAARAFAGFVLSPEGAAILRRGGFEPTS